jgi:hypothetical protein
MPSVVIARSGDTLCGLAIDAGFVDCAPLRAEAANSALLAGPLKTGDLVTIPDLAPKDVSKATEKRHRFIKKNAPPVAIRFVHGSPDKKYFDDFTLTILNVSNFVTNTGGNDGSKKFPAGFGFNANGHADVDAFKVEVADPAAGGSVTVLLEALKPAGLNPDGTPRHIPITGVADAAQRKIEALECPKVSPGHVAFRSRYMRLVVDGDDFTAAPGQTLLTTDLVDGGEEDVEVLDQKVRATYVVQRCPGTGGKKCEVTAELDVGEDEKRVKVAVHILQDPVTNVPVATPDQVRKRSLQFVRQLYAQGNMSLKLIAPIRQIPAPANMFAIANGNGQVAVGGQSISVRVQIDATFDQTIGLTTVAGEQPSQTADRLANAITDALSKATPPVVARVTPTTNPPLVGQAIGSADVIVGDPLTQTVRLTVLTSNDIGHPVQVGRIVSTTIPDFAAAEAHVGTIEERVLIKNYDTGTDRVDIFVVGALVGALGEAFTPRLTAAVTGQPIKEVANSALVFAATVSSANNFHTTIPHEIGHLLMDQGAHSAPVTEMMTNGSPVGAGERVVNGPKRISDRVINVGGGRNENPVNLLRNANTTLIE